MHGDPQAALAYLRWLRSRGPWILTAIRPDARDAATETATFTEDTAEQLVRWVSDRDGRANLYYMVNPARQAMTVKAKKEHVEAMEFLHVDLDPRKPPSELRPEELPGWVESERQRILESLEEFSPAPSAVVDSGGGYQAFWRLDEGLHIGGNLTLAEDAEAYNQQLAVVLGGDNTHNCDRIMRLPGTVNVPDEKKRKKGREERVAAVERLSDIIYSLSEFIAAPRVQTLGGGPKVEISGNLTFLKDLEELPERVSQRTRALIIQGDDPEDPTKYSSRSEVVWAVICELVRAGCPDDQIAAVLLDPDFGISGHIRDQKRPAEYVARQIQRAREEVEDPMLRKMNEEHAVIEDLGGKCRIISEVMDVTLKNPRMRISKQSFEDFRNRYMHIRVLIGQTKPDSGGNSQPIYAPAGKWWLSHPMRRQYKSLVFAPRREVPEAYNLWRGFSCEAIPGTRHESYLRHLLENICSGNEGYYHYLIRWMARCVQYPDEQGEVAIVMRGGRGTGKGTAVAQFGGLWGRHFLAVSSAKHLTGNFNSHLRDCVVLFADEAFFAGDKQHESVLKTLITEDTINIEGKGIDVEVGPNYTHLMVASNSDWVIPAGADERRFFMLEVGDDKKQNLSYFGTLRRDMSEGGRENLLHYLLNLDLSDFEVRDVPQTDALREQKLLSLGPEEQWWLERLMDGRTMQVGNDWSENVTKGAIQADYLRYCEDQRIFRRVSPTALGKFLTRVLPKDWPKTHQRMADVEYPAADGVGIVVKKERTYFYEFPGLPECREEWDRRYGGPYQWPREEERQEPGPNNTDPY